MKISNNVLLDLTNINGENAALQLAVDLGYSKINNITVDVILSEKIVRAAIKALLVELDILLSKLQSLNVRDFDRFCSLFYIRRDNLAACTALKDAECLPENVNRKLRDIDECFLGKKELVEKSIYESWCNLIS